MVKRLKSSPRATPANSKKKSGAIKKLNTPKNEEGYTPSPVDLDLVDFDKLSRSSVSNPGLVEFAASLGSANIAPLEEAHVRGTSMVAMSQQVSQQMNQILDQIKLLAGQYEKLQERQKVSMLIYTSKMTFVPVINQIYYLYRRDSGRFLSLIAPDEWGQSGKGLTFVAKIRLLADHTWDILEGHIDNKNWD